MTSIVSAASFFAPPFISQEPAHTGCAPLTPHTLTRPSTFYHICICTYPLPTLAHHPLVLLLSASHAADLLWPPRPSRASSSHAPRPPTSFQLSAKGVPVVINHVLRAHRLDHALVRHDPFPHDPRQPRRVGASRRLSYLRDWHSATILVRPTPRHTL
ncbi:hypothetical protein GGR56DRAFT_645195 [Xylariaceae sp. FL0804]|nr:hypothetical protein GGR56DRAFT_645195 [Xylariaceae sp. FL0804]